MKLLSNIRMFFSGILTLGSLKGLMESDKIIIVPEDFFEEDHEPISINDLKPDDYTKSMDMRGTPTNLCPCGCNIWNVKAVFDNYEIATYFLDMECANCGSLATAPTPIDRLN
jgi:hypothetical protein